MVHKDLERADIPYETHEGVADFHAAGRHSHIAGLITSGASIMEAKELARHADIRQTAKYTHIGMTARATALAGLEYPKASAAVELSGMCRDLGGVLHQEVSRAVSNGDSDGTSQYEKNPSGEGVSSFLVTDFQDESVDVSCRGGGNAYALPSRTRSLPE